MLCKAVIGNSALLYQLTSQIWSTKPVFAIICQIQLFRIFYKAKI
jgi:hypothetical protein